MTDNSERFKELAKVYLEQGSPVELEIASVSRSGSQLFVTFKGVDSREAAEKLVGNFISIEKDRLPELPDGDYYHFELVGMAVYTEAEQYLGEITEVIAAPANDVWQVEGEKDFLIPATANVVMKVDKAARRVIIRLLDGLID